MFFCIKFFVVYISFDVFVFFLCLVLKQAGIQGRKDLQSGSLLSTCQCRMIK